MRRNPVASLGAALGRMYFRELLSCIQYISLFNDFILLSKEHLGEALGSEYTLYLVVLDPTAASQPMIPPNGVETECPHLF